MIWKKKTRRRFTATLLLIAILLPGYPAFAAEKEANLIRIEGSNRYETALKVANVVNPNSGQYILASGENYPDALAGARLTEGKYPILLTPKNALDKGVAAKLRQNSAAQVYILGGTNTLSSAISSEVSEIGNSYTRLAGADRYETSAIIAGKKAVNRVVVASGTNFPDALAGSALALKNDAAIVLGSPSQIHPSVSAYLKGFANPTLTLLGGESTFSRAVRGQYQSFDSKLSQYAGSDRYETAARIAENFVNPESIIIATGENYPDALAAAPLAGKLNAPILLVRKNEVPAKVLQYIEKNRESIQDVYILGGVNSVSQRVGNSIAHALAVSQQPWQIAYEKVLTGEEPIRTERKSIRLTDSNARFTLHDFDRDGVPELVIDHPYLEQGGGESPLDLNDYFVLTYRDGLQTAFEYEDRTFYGRAILGYDPATDRLMQTTGHEAMHQQAYVLKNGKMVSVYYLRSGYYDDPAIETIEGVEKAITVSEYNKLSEKFGDTLQAFPFQNNTAAIRAELLRNK